MEVTDLTAAGLVDAVLKTLEENEILLQQMIGFAADNASVMMGKSGGVAALLKEKLPNLFVLGCICHSFALCSEAACKMLPNGVESLARDLFGYSAKSSARRQEFAQLQKMLDMKPHRL